MAHWAEVDENSIVVRVIITDSNDPNGDEGYQWLLDNFGGTWVKTSYNTLSGVHYLPDDQRDENGDRIPSGQPHVRYNFAGPGFLYDPIKDAFIAPKPPLPEELLGKYDFVLNEDTCTWELSPVGP